MARFFSTKLTLVSLGTQRHSTSCSRAATNSNDPFNKNKPRILTSHRMFDPTNTSYLSPIHIDSCWMVRRQMMSQSRCMITNDGIRRCGSPSGSLILYRFPYQFHFDCFQRKWQIYQGDYHPAFLDLKEYLRKSPEGQKLRGSATAIYGNIQKTRISSCLCMTLLYWFGVWLLGFKESYLSFGS